MKTIRIFTILCTLFFLVFTLSAQKTAFYENIQKEINIGKELYNHKKYNAVYRQFEKIQQNVEEKSEIYSEAEFYKAVSTLKAGHSSGRKLIDQFIDDYPESPYINKAWLTLGDYQFEKTQFKLALRSFSNVDRSDLPSDELIQLQYQTGYCFLMEDMLEQAASEFYQIKDAQSVYSKPASYYWAHIMYLQQNYESALQGFSKLNGDPVYSRVIPLYVSHIYYKQEKYGEVVNYTTTILNDVEEEHKTELSKIIGDSYFHLRDFNSAIPYLETYHNSPGPKTREDNYLLGYCYFHSGNFSQAAGLLEKASKGNDAMAQNAYYHLADCYIKLDEKEKAKLAFNAASEFDFDEKIKEDALFSFAKLTYELSYSPFNETIKAFDRYISLYPNSERNSEAYRYLVEVFMVTRNYRDAISSIEKIEVKTPAVLRAYQRVTFYRGLELFKNLAYNQAIDFFDLSLQNGNHDRELNARALFWKAEALYRVGDYNNSIHAYNQFLRTAGAYSLSEYENAEYNLAYAYFKIDDFNSAVSHFRKYVNAMSGKRTEKVADALNRIGDYYFLNTNYNLALENYQQSYNMKIFEADYALFQIAFCQGLQRKQQDKVNNLERLLSGFPESDFRDDALFELGRANERLGNNYEALKNYQLIIQEYNQGNYYSKALLQMGLINYNDGNFAEALKLYKEVIENFQGTQEAQTALLGIKNCYVEMNNVEGYFAYTNQLGTGANVTVSEQDSLIYMSAERLYMSGNSGATQQLQKYLQQYPNGNFVLNAHFYLAENLYKEGRYSEANEHYSYVAFQPNNLFSEPAISRASELTFNAEKFELALELFKKLELVANSNWNILKAYIGQMRSNFKLNRYNETIAAGEKVKKSKVVDGALIREANYNIGKSYYLIENLNAALTELKMVATDTKIETGAEAKYLVAEILYRQGNKNESENEIMDFITQGTPFQFWLGKAFILLADIYVDKGDEFQAKHTLKSLIENYNAENDGVKAKAAEKLAAIEAKEQKEQKEAIDNSLQIKLNEK